MEKRSWKEKLDPRVKENWRFTTNIWFWVLVVALIGFLVVRFGPWS
jgi:hypothetical protein